MRPMAESMCGDRTFDPCSEEEVKGGWYARGRSKRAAAVYSYNQTELSVLIENQNCGT